jgi:hypothetical protein
MGDSWGLPPPLRENQRRRQSRSREEKHPPIAEALLRPSIAPDQVLGARDTIHRHEARRLRPRRADPARIDLTPALRSSANALARRLLTSASRAPATGHRNRAANSSGPRRLTSSMPPPAFVTVIGKTSRPLALTQRSQAKPARDESRPRSPPRDRFGRTKRSLPRVDDRDLRPRRERLASAFRKRFIDLNRRDFARGADKLHQDCSVVAHSAPDGAHARRGPCSPCRTRTPTGSAGPYSRDAARRRRSRHRDIRPMGLNRLASNSPSGPRAQDPQGSRPDEALARHGRERLDDVACARAARDADKVFHARAGDEAQFLTRTSGAPRESCRPTSRTPMGEIERNERRQPCRSDAFFGLRFGIIRFSPGQRGAADEGRRHNFSRPAFR